MTSRHDFHPTTQQPASEAPTGPNYIRRQRIVKALGVGSLLVLAYNALPSDDVERGYEDPTSTLSHLAEFYARTVHNQTEGIKPSKVHFCPITESAIDAAKSCETIDEKLRKSDRFRRTIDTTAPSVTVQKGWEALVYEFNKKGSETTYVMPYIMGGITEPDFFEMPDTSEEITEN